MNNARRKELALLQEWLDNLKSALEDLSNDVRTQADEERDGFNNMTEGLQQTEQGQRIEAAADALDTAHENLEEMISLADVVFEAINEATE